MGEPVLDKVTAPLQRTSDLLRRDPRWASQKIEVGNARERFEAQFCTPADQSTAALFRRYSEIFRNRRMIKQITAKRERQTRNLVTAAHCH